MFAILPVPFFCWQVFVQSIGAIFDGCGVDWKGVVLGM
jgi:hypothetical protein